MAIALFVTLSWLSYILFFAGSQIRLFWLSIGTMCLSFFCSEISPYIYDLFEFSFGWTFTGRTWEDFIYCVFGIGLSEELVKQLPILLVILLRKGKIDPFVLITIVSASALGFSWSENSVYYSYYQGIKYLSRALTSTMGHIVMSNLFVYGILIHRANHATPSYVFPLYMALSVLAHGLYDFLLTYSLTGVFILDFSVQY